MLSDIYQEIYSIFYLYLKVDIMKRQANECCDVLFSDVLMTSLGIFSCLIIVSCGDGDYFAKC